MLSNSRSIDATCCIGHQSTLVCISVHLRPHSHIQVLIASVSVSPYHGRLLMFYMQKENAIRLRIKYMYIFLLVIIYRLTFSAYCSLRILFTHPSDNGGDQYYFNYFFLTVIYLIINCMYEFLIIMFLLCIWTNV